MNKTADGSPINLKCRVCGEVLTEVTDTLQALAHVTDKHSNALYLTGAIGSLFLSAHLFTSDSDPTIPGALDFTTGEPEDRWDRNIKSFYLEFCTDLSTAIAGGIVERLTTVFGENIPKMTETGAFFKILPAAPANPETPTSHGSARHRAGQARPGQPG